MQSVSIWDFLFLFMHPIPPFLSLSQLSDASFNEPISLPALREDLRKLLIFSAILVFSMLLKCLMFGILFCFIFFFQGNFEDTVPLLDGHCIFGVLAMALWFWENNNFAAGCPDFAGSSSEALP